MFRKLVAIGAFSCLLVGSVTTIGCGNDGSLEVRPAPGATVPPTATPIPDPESGPDE